MKSEHKTFRTIGAWKKAAQSAGLKFRRVSMSLSRGEYWQAYQEGTIVGYCLTKPKFYGHILREVL